MCGQHSRNPSSLSQSSLDLGHWHWFCSFQASWMRLSQAGTGFLQCHHLHTIVLPCLWIGFIQVGKQLWKHSVSWLTCCDTPCQDMLDGVRWWELTRGAWGTQSTVGTDLAPTFPCQSLICQVVAGDHLHSGPQFFHVPWCVDTWQYRMGAAGQTSQIDIQE